MLPNSCSWTRPNVSKPALLTDVRQHGGKKTLRAIPRPRRCSLCVMALQSDAVPSDSKYFFSDSQAPTTQLLNRKSIYKPITSKSTEGQAPAHMRALSRSSFRLVWVGGSRCLCFCLALDIFHSPTMKFNFNFVLNKYFYIAP